MGVGMGSGIDTGDTARVLGAAAPARFQRHGLGRGAVGVARGRGPLCGGRVRSKNVLGTMMQSVAAIAIVSVVWLLAGYTFAFGPGVGGGHGGGRPPGVRG